MRESIEYFPLGEFIKEELEARNWTLKDLAYMMTRDPQVNEVALEFLLIDGSLLIDDQTIKDISAAFQCSEDYLRNLYIGYKAFLRKRKAPSGR